METLFNNLAKHQDSLSDYSSLITTMYHKVNESPSKWIDKNLKSDDLTKIWDCCNDLKLIFENAPLYLDYKSFTQRLSQSLFSGRSINDCLWAIQKLCKLYFGIISENEYSLYQRVQQKELCKEIENIIQDSIRK